MNLLIFFLNIFWIIADLMEKKGKALKEKLKPIIVKQYKESGKKFSNISHRTQTSHPIDKDKFFQWVKLNWPEKVDSLKIDMICPFKFERAYVLGEIDYDSLPEEVYTTTTSEVITVRVKNDNST